MNVVAGIEEIRVGAYRLPTGQPESDGTLAWDSTTLVLVEIIAGGVTGIGYTYADRSAAVLIHDRFVALLHGHDAFAIPACWDTMVRAARNLGRPGIASTAVSAVDTALWDWKAKYLRLPLSALLGKAHDSVLAYGSGGFTSFTQTQLEQQLREWVGQGFPAVKMKVGRDPQSDAQRVAAARSAIGERTALFVDANGAYTRKQALDLAQHFAESGVTWFEEPVSADDLPGLRMLRDRAPAGMNISAGEYGWTVDDFRRLLEHQAVDVLQADATRCGGITGFLMAAALCESFHVPLSSHCAPSLHAPVMCCVRPALHVEYFADHVRIEQMLFDGAPVARDGRLAPDLSRPGLGLEFKAGEAACFRL